MEPEELQKEIKEHKEELDKPESLATIVVDLNKEGIDAFVEIYDQEISTATELGALLKVLCSGGLNKVIQDNLLDDQHADDEFLEKVFSTWANTAIMSNEELEDLPVVDPLYVFAETPGATQ